MHRLYWISKDRQTSIDCGSIPLRRIAAAQTEEGRRMLHAQCGAGDDGRWIDDGSFQIEEVTELEEE